MITALLPRGKGTLLIGTQDHGWNLWNGQGFERVTKDRLANTSIHAILDDGRNHLWFATGNGIARCDCAGIAGVMEGVDCRTGIEFTTADGLISRERRSTATRRRGRPGTAGCGSQRPKAWNLWTRRISR